MNLRHPNILTVIDVGQENGLPYAVMDYMSGGSVNDQRHRDTDGNFVPIIPVFFDKWLNRIADALDFIHRKGYVHRAVMLHAPTHPERTDPPGSHRYSSAIRLAESKL